MIIGIIAALVGGCFLIGLAVWPFVIVVALVKWLRRRWKRPAVLVAQSSEPNPVSE